MKDQSRTDQDLLEEISSLKQKIKQLEQSQSELREAKESLQESETTPPLGRISTAWTRKNALSSWGQT
jgi:prefoldin subunit 5